MNMKDVASASLCSFLIDDSVMLFKSCQTSESPLLLATRASSCSPTDGLGLLCLVQVHFAMSASSGKGKVTIFLHSISVSRHLQLHTVC